MAVIKRIAGYLNDVKKRLSIFIFLMLLSFIMHRIFSRYGQDVPGAFLFIVIFSIGAIFYYFNLLRDKTLHKYEFMISIISVFLLTITMFALIYAEPIEDSKNYFIQLGRESDLTLPDALYFSTATITTLGFGDIVPVGVYRYFVMIEVLLGLVFIGTMVYFLVRAFDS